MMPHIPPQALSELKLFGAYAVFLGSYLVFALGKFPGMKIDRPGAGIIGAVLMVAFRIILPADALRFIDFSTIVLLFSMMLIVAYLHLGPIAFFGLLLELIYLLCARAGTRDPVTDLPDPVEAVDRALLVKPGIVILLVISGFFAGVPPALMAAFGAAIMLITRSREPRRVYDEVDWGLLAFFVGLFVIVGGAEKAGITERLLGFATHWNLHHPAIFTVVVAAFSNIVSNVPAVMLLKSLVPGFANPHTGWLVLAMASTLAGNLTITGSVANIIVVERAKNVAPISFREYFQVGLPITVATLVFGSVWLWLIQ
jgi:Na+/H+ antiporter NhaD/arsenite permease-like protein